MNSYVLMLRLRPVLRRPGRKWGSRRTPGCFSGCDSRLPETYVLERCWLCLCRRGGAGCVERTAADRYCSVWRSGRIAPHGSCQEPTSLWLRISISTSNNRSFDRHGARFSAWFRSVFFAGWVITSNWPGLTTAARLSPNKQFSDYFRTMASS